MKASELKPGMAVSFPMKNSEGKAMKPGIVSNVTTVPKSKAYIRVWLEQDVNRIRVITIQKDSEVEVDD